ncbi:MAG TPA: hypothetical protein VGO22_04190, partial [Pseudorhizobium sp.]|nr:hypothetical protein [Pseudorhizobium sp.]
HSLRKLDDKRLSKLGADCEAWCAWMKRFRADLSTPAGRTEWDVLMRQEHEEVAAAHGRVQDEISARKSS